MPLSLSFSVPDATEAVFDKPQIHCKLSLASADTVNDLGNTPATEMATASEAAGGAVSIAGVPAAKKNIVVILLPSLSLSTSSGSSS